MMVAKLINFHKNKKAGTIFAPAFKLKFLFSRYEILFE